jgi:hypothetical protein
MGCGCNIKKEKKTETFGEKYFNKSNKWIFGLIILILIIIVLYIFIKNECENTLDFAVVKVPQGLNITRGRIGEFGRESHV